MDDLTYVAGHRGLVGSALVRLLEKQGQPWVGADRQTLDLLDRSAVFDFLHQQKPTKAIIAAARVGGIVANSTFPVEFLSENIQIATNLLDACHSANVERVLFLGSSCIYPRMSPQPIKEEYLLTGPLEPTNESYALAKISGLKLVSAYRKQFGRRWISAMPTNLYGPGDNFDLESSHVLPATIRKYHEAQTRGAEEVIMWGTGKPMREFLHVDDLAEACLHLLDVYDEDICINVGTGVDVTISELSSVVAEVVGYDGVTMWDTSRPDGMPRKLLDVSRIRDSGWDHSVSLRDGISSTYQWYLENLADLRGNATQS
jgi:GDP-L-fucose synthase